MFMGDALRSMEGNVRMSVLPPSTTTAAAATATATATAPATTATHAHRRHPDIEREAPLLGDARANAPEPAIAPLELAIAPRLDAPRELSIWVCRPEP